MGKLKTDLLSILALALAWGGCSGRSLGSHSNNTANNNNAVPECAGYADCNNGADCGELVRCVDGQCRPDLPPDSIPCVLGECTSDDECVVAVPANCCYGCPDVVPRGELSSMECFFEDAVPEPYPEGCNVVCTRCLPCYPQPVGARCAFGQCVPTDEGCPIFGQEQYPTVTSLQLVQNAAQYDGQVHRITGAILPGYGDCDGGPGPGNCDFPPMLNGVVRLAGYLCNLSIHFLGTHCADVFTSETVAPGGWYEFEGEVHANPSPWEPPYVDVTGFRIVEPQDVGGGYAVTVTEIVSDAADPTCVPPERRVGDTGRVFLAVSGAQVRAAAPMFGCWWDLSGGFDDENENTFTVWAPIDCDGCCCDFSISGEVLGDQLTGQYETFDGVCRHTVYFTGARQAVD